MTPTSFSTWSDRFKASSLHLVISMAIAAAAGLLVFGLWYPYPYREISGGRELFLLVVAVDVVVGPLITFTVFNLAKPKTELVRDLALVGIIQLFALSYGVWSVYVARPVHLVFEFDRFRVVHAIEIPEELLNQKPADIDPFPLAGPTLLAVRPFRSVKEEGAATMVALQGISFSARPDFWQPYSDARARVIAAAKPAADLRKRFPQQLTSIDMALKATGHDEDKLAYLPLVSRATAWTVLLDADTAEIRGFVPLNSF